MPPTNIDASPCTLAIGLSGSNQRSPSGRRRRPRSAAPPGPAMRSKIAAADGAAHPGDGVLEG